METGATDNGSGLVVDWQSAFLDQGFPNNPKVYSDVVIEYQTEAGGSSSPETLTVSVIPDSGTGSEVTLGTISSAARTTTVLSLPDDYETRNIAVRITGTIAQPVMIYGVWIHYYVLERRALSFDSGPTDLSPDGRVCDIDGIEVTIRSAATITWTLFTDWGSSGLVSQATGTIAATPRTTVVIPTAKTRGFQYRLVLNSTGEFQVFTARLRIQPLGETVPFTSPMLPLT
jgi:hypothetical protein